MPFPIRNWPCLTRAFIVVPWEENTGEVAQRYRELGGDIQLIGKPGCKHHPHGLDDCRPIVDFILKHTIN